MVFSGNGSGTAEDPYQIINWAQLSEMNSYLTSHFILMNNLSNVDDDYATYNTAPGWPTIANSGSFTGVFDGNGYTISNLFIQRTNTSARGLFGNIGVGGEVRNVGLLDVSITTSLTGSWNIGGLAGYHRGTITNCYSTGLVKGGSSTGGLVGENNTGTITNSYSTCTVDTNKFGVGGLVGKNNSNGVITNCYATGTITTTDSMTGGLLGWNTSGTVTNCYSTGLVTGTGGLIGYASNDGSTANSFWDTETSGKATSSGGTGKTTAEMKDFDTFNNATWDIVLIGDYVDSVWAINDGTDYPVLGWSVEVSSVIKAGKAGLPLYFRT